jgi:hypothetical protein
MVEEGEVGIRRESGRVGMQGGNLARVRVDDDDCGLPFFVNLLTRADEPCATELLRSLHDVRRGLVGTKVLMVSFIIFFHF